jgi:hypothetical protein
LKKAIVTFILSLVVVAAICQVSTTAKNFNNNLKSKLSAINNYVKSIDGNSNLITSSIIMDFSDGTGGSTETYYTDSLKKDMVKHYSNEHNNSFTIYYQNGQLVFSIDQKDRYTVKCYYENNKIISTNFNLKNETVKQIIYITKSGDSSRTFIRLYLEKDTSSFYISIYYPKHYSNTLKDKGNKSYWDKLTTSFKISDFEKVNGMSKIDSGGSDEQVNILTEHYSFSIINGENDANNYKKLDKLIRLLKNKVRMNSGRLVPPPSLSNF